MPTVEADCPEVSPFLQPRPSNLPAAPMPAEAASGDYLWCLMCERTFRPSQQRRIGEHLLCPHAPCEGGLLFEPWAWSQVRGSNTSYPAIPLEDVAYPFFGAAGPGHPED